MNRKFSFATAFAVLLAASAVNAQSVRLSPSETGRQTHVARQGDTLFDLASRFLGDAMRWPELWSFNPQITNPHWIYPGDIVFLEGVRPAEPPVRAALATAGYIPLGGFYTAEERENFGTLRYANTGRRLLATHDTVYLDLDDRENVRVGDLFAINRIIGRVEGSRRNSVVAVKYLVTGMVRVTALHEETELVSAEIIQLWDTIERGDLLFTAELQRMHPQRRAADVDLEGLIVDHLTPNTQLHEEFIVFINLGSEDGVVPGNRFVIWDRQDEAEEIRAARTWRLDYERDIRSQLPWEVAGEALVIYTTEQYSTALVTEAGLRELRDGMRVTMQEGY